MPSKPPANKVEGLGRLARRLEADWQAALRKHEEHVHQQFRDLRNALHGQKAAKLPPGQVARLGDALVPRLKPSRGRVKDLRRVEEALGQALEQVP